MNNIRDMIEQYVRDTGQAHIEIRAGLAGVIFHDESEFIPFADLGYDRQLGFYRLSDFPDVLSQANSVNPWSLHPVRVGNGERQYALLDNRANMGYLLGDFAALANAAEALLIFLGRGLLGEPLADDDERLGVRWLTIAEAMAEATAYDLDEYPPGENLAQRIRQAARRGTIGGVAQDAAGRYKFQARRFRAWLARREPRNV